MKLHHALICCFLLALQDGNTGRVSAKVHTGQEGGNITVGCDFTFSGKRRLFCKGRCEEGNILIDTREDTAQRDRYSVQYKENSVLSSDVLYVSITKLQKSDSGQYSCGLGRTVLPDSYHDFEIVVTEAPTTSEPSSTLNPFPTSTFLPSAAATTQHSGRSSSSPSSSTLNPFSTSTFLPSASAAATTTTTQSSGRSSSSPSSSTSETSIISVPAKTPDRTLLCVALILVALIVTLSVALLFFCKKRMQRRRNAEAEGGTTEGANGPPVETEYALVTEANRIYEEIRESEGRKDSSAVEKTTYAYVNHSKPNGAEDQGEYSLVSLHNRNEDDLSNLDYTEVNFSNTPANMLNSAPPGDTTDVTYSTLQL
ncbi:flocculation protein FLO11-like isoform X2 [Parambassis ranga]|uniref:Flocculation protein FLO11-like isoform X2 n=1 Tax=Parambassis ranga TaxID=210632 RepID=A0A6P7IH64_9TELE|nr:flocculation protein FLO11-like isoform X2 [Parambassis ranga]